MCEGAAGVVFEGCGCVRGAHGRWYSCTCVSFSVHVEVVGRSLAWDCFTYCMPQRQYTQLQHTHQGGYVLLLTTTNALCLLPHRFLVQNVQRWELETGQVFIPMAAGAADSSSSSQQQQQEPAAVLDRWILAAARSLTAFVRQEMEGYRLYTVVPQLVTFIDQLTNIYVRYNRKRLKVGLRCRGAWCGVWVC